MKLRRWIVWDRTTGIALLEVEDVPSAVTIVGVARAVDRAGLWPNEGNKNETDAYLWSEYVALWPIPHKTIDEFPIGVLNYDATVKWLEVQQKRCVKWEYLLNAGKMADELLTINLGG